MQRNWLVPIYCIVGMPTVPPSKSDISLWIKFSSGGSGALLGLDGKYLGSVNFTLRFFTLLSMKPCQTKMEKCGRGN